MNNICLIPARGGSKRIPYKNIVDFMGKPMISYTIEAADKSGLFGEHIYVSSDSEKILSVVDSYPNIKKIRRPDEISGDGASLEEATFHLLANNLQKFDYLCMLMPNCPLRNADDIKKSYELLLQQDADCMMSVLDYYWLYPFWALQEKDGKLDLFWGRQYLIDSKKFPQNIYCPSGAIRWVKVDHFLEEKSFWGKNLVKYKICFERGADIDTPEDLELAKKFYKIIYG